MALDVSTITVHTPRRGRVHAVLIVALDVPQPTVPGFEVVGIDYRPDGVRVFSLRRIAKVPAGEPDPRD